MNDSSAKLDRRVKEFLMQANADEKQSLELGRTQLISLLKEAQIEYANKYPEMSIDSIESKRQKYKTKLKASLRSFSEGAYEYSKIMDLLISQAPEYTALAWGAIKILLVVQVNHEELKQKVKEHIERIRSSFEIVDHVTVLIPRKNLVASIAKAYELFTRFLAKAVKYYSMNRFSKAPLQLHQDVKLISFRGNLEGFFHTMEN